MRFLPPSLANRSPSFFQINVDTEQLPTGLLTFNARTLLGRRDDEDILSLVARRLAEALAAVDSRRRTPRALLLAISLRPECETQAAVAAIVKHVEAECSWAARG